MRCEKYFMRWWVRMTKEGEKSGTDETKLLKGKKLHQHSLISIAQPFHQLQRTNTTMLNFEALDTVTSYNKERLSRRVIKCTTNLRTLVESDYGSESGEVFTLSSDNFDRNILQAQLSTFMCNYKIEEDMEDHISC